MQYQDLYNIPQTAFDDALRENEVESETEELEREIEGEDGGVQFVAADSDEESENEMVISVYRLDDI